MHFREILQSAVRNIRLGPGCCDQTLEEKTLEVQNVKFPLDIEDVS